jgi:glycosyltransferase involved in cell wall biosynthesis
MRIGVHHVITGLSTGGAEMMLFKLLSRLDPERYWSEVTSLTDIGPAGEKIQALGIPVTALGMRRGLPDPRALLRLARILRRRPPALLQTWMYHSDLIGGFAAKLARNIPVIWGIRASSLDPAINGQSAVLTARLCASLSSFIPEAIVCCSEAGRWAHAALGYQQSKLRVIPNGFDIDSSELDLNARRALRQEWGIDESAVLVGHVARFDPMKDHRGFVETAARVHAKIPSTRFIFCGDGVDRQNSALVEWIRAAGIEDACILLGPRADVQRIYAALDVFVMSSSHAEGFPNVLGEAMASAVPCVATDVGDARLIIGDTGYVVPTREPTRLSEALISLLELEPQGRARLGLAARMRVVERFSLPTVVGQYESLYEEILTKRLLTH